MGRWSLEVGRGAVRLMCSSGWRRLSWGSDEGARSSLVGMSRVRLDGLARWFLLLAAMCCCVALFPARAAAISWSPQTVIDPAFDADSVSCSSSTFCVAVDEQSLVSTFSGGAWSEPSLLPLGMQSVSCPSSTFCVAAGFGVTMYDGSTWSAEVDVDPHQILDAVSCPSTTFCMASDRVGNVVTFDGRSWSSPVNVDPDPANGTDYGMQVACASATFCVTVDNAGHSYVYANGAWSGPMQVDAIDLASISCPTAGFCEAASGGAVFTFDGLGWNQGYSVGLYVSSISCSSPSFCAVAGEDGSVATFNGVSWSEPKVVDDFSGFGGVSCASGSFCMAADQDGGSFDFDGSAWSASIPVTIGSGALTTASCVAEAFCGAIDSNGVASIYQNGVWGTPAQAVPGPTLPGFGVESLSCATATFCMAAGRDDVAGFNGSAWSDPTQVDGVSRQFTSVSCPSTQFCAAVDDQGFATQFNGASWSAPASIDYGGNLVAVSCSSASFCAAGDRHGAIMLWQNGSWSAPVSVDSPESIESISCASETFCVATDSAGKELTYNGNTWSSPANVDPTGKLLAVSCPLPGLCVAIDSANQSLTFDDGSWQPPAPIIVQNVGITGLATSISCASAAMCVIVTGSGTAILGSEPTPPPPANVDPPTISGSTVVGQTLTASPGSWTNDPTSYSYQWQRCDLNGMSCVAIPGALFASYTLTDDDIGDTIRVQVVAINDGGYSPAVVSAPSDAVLPLIPVNLDLPTLTGIPAPGQTLSASAGEWSNSPTSYAYQWEQCDLVGENCTTIAGASAPSYTLTDGQVGDTIRVEVIASNAGGSSPPAVSDPSGIVLPLAPANVAPPVLAGLTIVGQTITASAGTWTNAPTSYSYEWEQCTADGTGCTMLPTETSPSYTLTIDDIGHTIRVEVIAANSGGASSPASSAATAIIASAATGASAPSDRSRPTLSGKEEVGHVLSGTPGSWTGMPPITYSYQWERCSGACVAIPRATSPRYKLTRSDTHQHLVLRVSAANRAGSASALSAPTKRIAIAGPTRTQINTLLSRLLAQGSSQDVLRAVIARTEPPLRVNVPGPGKVTIKWVIRTLAHRVNIATATKVAHRPGKLEIRSRATRETCVPLQPHQDITVTAVYTPMGERAVTASRTAALKTGPSDAVRCGKQLI